MLRSTKLTTEDNSLPNRVVVDFLEGTLRKKDAVAFARGFIDNHFEAPNASGYFVMPYEEGYVFEVHEGGHQHAYLPGILQALEDDPAASACIQMARRVLEVKRSPSGSYTAILLPERVEPQNPDTVFPNPSAPLTPYERSGLNVLLTGAVVFGAGFLFLLLATLFYLVQVSGILAPPLKSIDFKAMPLSQWKNLETAAGGDSTNYIRALRYQNGAWSSEVVQRPPSPLEQPAPEALTQPAQGAANGAAAANTSSGSTTPSGLLPPGIAPSTSSGAATTTPGQPSSSAGTPATPLSSTMPGGSPSQQNPAGLLPPPNPSASVLNTSSHH